MKRCGQLITLVSVLVTLLVVSAALAHPAGAKTSPPSEWAPALCRTMSAWQDSVNRAAAGAQPALTGQVADLGLAKTQIVTFLDAAMTETDKALDRLRTAGAPRSTNGDGIAAAFLEGFQSAESVFTRARDTVAALPTDDVARFTSGMATVLAALDQTGNGVARALTNLTARDEHGKLGKAIVRSKACAFLDKPA